MKKLFTLLVAVLLMASVFAQSPEKMSYQAVIRNSSDVLVTDTQIGMQISILQGTADGSPVYVETQTATTNANGLVSIEIGDGTVLNGVFSSIDWANGSYYIKTETDPAGGTSYTITGTSQLLSVPYALYAKTAKTVTGGITETDPAFAAWDKSTGISITESQVSDLDHFTNSDETDPVFMAWDKDYNDLTGTPTIPADLSDLTDNTSLLFSGNYNDLSNLPTLFDGAYSSLTGTPTTIAGYGITDAFDGQYGSLTGLPTLFSGSFTDLSNTPTTIEGYGITDAFSGSYTDLTNQPANATTSTDGFMSSVDKTKLDGIATGAEANVQADWNQATTTADDYIKNKPSLSTVATSGSYTDLTDQPTTITTVQADAITANTAKVSATTYSVGDFAQGGIVFWVDETGQHGLVAAKEDQSTGVRWYAGTYGNTQAKGDGPFAGEANTSIIIAAQVAIGDDGNTYAARICNELQVTEGGKTYGDWFLPSKEELNLMYQNKATIDATAGANGGSAFASAVYWSSAEGNNGSAWYQYFAYGFQGSSNKTSTYGVRAVRAF